MFMSLNGYPTVEMRTTADQRRLLSEAKAVLCVWFEWSGPAVLARRAVTHWHERWHLYCRTPVVPLYLLDGDKLPECFDWIRDTLREVGGYGSLYLFKQGALVHSFTSVMDAGLTLIEPVMNISTAGHNLLLSPVSHPAKTGRSIRFALIDFNSEKSRVTFIGFALLIRN